MSGKAAGAVQGAGIGGERATETSEDLAPVLRSILAALYAQNPAPLARRIASECTIITDSGETVLHQKEIARNLPEFAGGPPLRLGESDFRTIDPGGFRGYADAGQSIITGSYRLYTAADVPLIYAAQRQVTAIFTRSPEGLWQARHLHLSRKDSLPVDDSLFPIKTTREIYDYVRRILGTARKTGILPSRIVVKDGTQLHYLDPAGILYVEALGKRCMVHEASGTLPLNELLSEVESQLPGTFVRTHRSFLVNAAHMRSIERYRITLSDGTVLPIPKQRFDQVRRELELRVAES